MQTTKLTSRPLSRPGPGTGSPSLEELKGSIALVPKLPLTLQPVGTVSGNALGSHWWLPISHGAAPAG
ncbi:hypothetical protein HYALB_00004655 [Hymenoscyphus albidus]|uniref:Uncharacterized protein n=1 Tax=Hymenoscyphus albidus TaxID=595503 RepID=A0A9N9PXN8_9HELO|nr:hypothetical protein HYALB_00004655 [Hymenoscyphus albidus]